jgi:DNA repair protein RadC
MYTPIAPAPSIKDQVLGHLATIFGSHAQTVFDECGGSAIKLIDMLRHKTGCRWDLFRAARGIHEIAMLEMAAKGPAMNAPATTQQFLKHYLSTRPFETFLLLHLDARNHLLAVEELFRGDISGCTVHPREVLRSVIEHNSSGVIMAHVHPSKNCQSSVADEILTQRLKDLLVQAEVRVLDHIIVGGDSCLSFAARGLL